jgi:hypothetical protein
MRFLVDARRESTAYLLPRRSGEEHRAMKSCITRAAIVLCGTLVPGPRVASAQTTRISVDSSGAEANDDSHEGSLSADGTIVAFQSLASNLVPGDTNHSWDAFVRDLATGVTERVSVSSSGVQANGSSQWAVISADGRCVAFSSYASNLVASDTNGCNDVFVHDRSTGITERVSVSSSGSESGFTIDTWPSLSADGRFVSFSSLASNLVDGDTNQSWDVFVHDRATGITERVSVDSSGAEGNRESSIFSTISADGRFVAFSSAASNLVADDTNGSPDCFVHDRATGITERVSVDSSGAQTRGGSDIARISADGSVVGFISTADDLVANDDNSMQDVFVRDRARGVTEIVSVDSSGGSANRDSYAPWVSADGRFVLFESSSSDLVDGDDNGATDAFLHDRASGSTERVSVGPSGAEAAGISYASGISANGRTVAFFSGAGNLVADDANHVFDVFVNELGALPGTWLNYGRGLAGTQGVPSFAARSDPVLGTTVTLDLANSFDDYTVGALFLGFERTTLPSSWGGDLLVVPVITQLVGLSPWGATLFGDLPDDDTLIGVVFDLQTLESDPGAAKGVSFTRGLELVLGR